MLLLDTCTLLWLAAESESLSPAARDSIRVHSGSLFVSAISAFEIGIKSARKALRLPIPAEEWFSRALVHHGITELTVDSRIALRAAALPRLHSDPFDRLIIATALLQQFSIVTPDHLISAYPEVRTLW